MQLDKKDRMIVSLYAKDPSVSQEQIAKEVDLSQPSVAVRIRKLKESGAIQTITGINPLKMGLYMAKVDIASNNPSVILDMFRNCPYFANGFTISGRNNLCLMFVSENIATLESIVNGHLRSSKFVKELDFNIIISAERDLVLPTVLTPEQSKTPPCGVDIQCRDCRSFTEKKCMGCPITGQYQGWFY